MQIEVHRFLPPPIVEPFFSWQHATIHETLSSSPLPLTLRHFCMKRFVASFKKHVCLDLPSFFISIFCYRHHSEWIWKKNRGEFCHVNRVDLILRLQWNGVPSSGRDERARERSSIDWKKPLNNGPRAGFRDVGGCFGRKRRKKEKRSRDRPRELVTIQLLLPLLPALCLVCAA